MGCSDAYGLSQGRNAMAIWQELVDTFGFAAGYQSVRRFARKLHPSQSPEACAVIETAPGEDYGECCVMVRTCGDPGVLPVNLRREPVVCAA
jgi:hypothetical protein